MSDSMTPHGLYPARLLCPWNSLGKNTGVGSLSLLQYESIKLIKSLWSITCCSICWVKMKAFVWIPESLAHLDNQKKKTEAGLSGKGYRKPLIPHHEVSVPFSSVRFSSVTQSCPTLCTFAKSVLFYQGTGQPSVSLITTYRCRSSRKKGLVWSWLRLSMSLEAWYLSIKPDKLNARQFKLKIEKLQCITYRFPGEGNGNPLQYSWEIPWMEELGRPQSMGLQKSWTRLSS